MSEPVPVHQVWSRLDQILTDLAVTGIWSRQDEIIFLEGLATAEDFDLADLAQARLKVLRRMH